MTTKATRPVSRETSAFVRDRGMRPLIATLHGSMLILRGKGLRREETIDIRACYDMAVKQRVARERAEKRKKVKGA
uniref:hypothetical protein n=1 Tax=Sulfuriferula sp. GW6 TaxID=3345112 RepID=UPI0039F680B9